MTAAVSDEQLEILREVGFASAMIVPLRARGRVLGTIALASAASDRRFTEDDLAMARELADRCALVLDNALLFAERSYIAETLQVGLLPAALPDIPQVELAAHYRAGREQADVGGDFYDVFGAGGAWMFVIGDVVRKGAKAAAITGLARHTLRGAALYERSPAQMVRVLNRAMRDQFTDEEQFCTAAVVRPARRRAVRGARRAPTSADRARRRERSPRRAARNTESGSSTSRSSARSAFACIRASRWSCTPTG
jgi:Stage II sporulation protein E (SpoIIE)/GAF domain